METITIHTESANLTEEQFFNLCSENKELRFERDQFQNIFIMAPTGSNTGNYHIEIASELRNWNKRTKLGICFDSSAGFTLPNGAMRAPDAAWISKERWDLVSQDDKERFAHICPDFVIEVRSKSDSLKEQKAKMVEWIENGCRLAWLIDVENRNTFIYKQGKEVLNKDFSDTLSGEDILNGFEIKLSEIIS